MRRVREVVTKPEYFNMLTNLASTDDYLPDPNNFYFKVGGGLVIYEPKGACLEMHTAVKPEDMPAKPIQGLHEQWAWLAERGFYSIYSTVRAGHIRAMMMCRAAGMTRRFTDINFTIYEKVIFNG